MKHYTKEFKNEIVKRFLNRETVISISSDTKTAVELLKLNITKNFNGIKDVILFMMGQEVYTQESVEQEK